MIVLAVDIVYNKNHLKRNLNRMAFKMGAFTNQEINLIHGKLII